MPGDKFAYSSGEINFFMLSACILSISFSNAFVTNLCFVNEFFPSNFGLTQTCISNALPHDPEVSVMLMCVASNFDLSNSSIAATDDICFQTNLCAYNFLKILTRETPTIWLSLKVVTMLPNDGPLLPPQTQRRRRATTSRRTFIRVRPTTLS